MTLPVAATADFSVEEDSDRRRISARGDWLMPAIGPVFRRLDEIAPEPGPLEIDLSEVGRMDTGGAWVIHRTMKRLAGKGADVRLIGANEAHQFLIDKMRDHDEPCAVEPEPGSVIAERLAGLGAWAMDACAGMSAGLAFTGRVAVVMAGCALRPRRFRFTSLVYHMETVGFDALPIVGLITFLIGVVIAYMGAELLRPYGGEVFFTDLLGVVMLRELGVLLTAVIIAGRSGSAFTAQIGSMVLHEEVDAMRTLGLDPIEVLVVPRVVALVLTLPILAFFGDLMGLFGGGLMAWVVLDTPPSVFIERLADAIELDTFFVGLSRAPFFAVIIALAGCYEGLQVKGSAESVGHHTTKSVVEAIFMVIVTTAFFSVFYLTIGV